MSILDLQIESTQQRQPAQATTERKVSEFWLNVGVVLPGAGKPDADGNPTDLFVNLPNGIPLDDMKPAKVTGTNRDFIHLNQTKNAILEQLQKAAANLKPGERMRVPLLTVELARKADNSPTGTVEDNPLLSQLFGMGIGAG